MFNAFARLKPKRQRSVIIDDSSTELGSKMSEQQRDCENPADLTELYG
jgi:hypothetical protein